MGKTARGIVLAMCLAAAALVALPSMAFAEEMHVGGQKITPDTYYLNEQDDSGAYAKGDAENYNFYYDGATMTLHLNEADIKGDPEGEARVGEGIKCDSIDVLTIRTEGDGSSSIVGGAGSDKAHTAIWMVSGSVVFEGDQKLRISTLADRGDASELISSSSAPIFDGNVEIVSTNSPVLLNCPGFVYKGGKVAFSGQKVMKDGATFDDQSEKSYWRESSESAFEMTDSAGSSSGGYLELTDSASGIPVHVGDFVVTGLDNCTYNADAGLLTIEGDAKVSNFDSETPTADRIDITKSATVTLAGLNIETDTGSPIYLKDDNGVDVKLLLEGENTLVSNCSSRAAIHKCKGQNANESDHGTLVIDGDGILNATGPSSAAGIGGADCHGDVWNITINGGTINAKSGDDWASAIGASEGGSCWNIVIDGGVVKADGSIGATAYGGVKDARITGGMVIASGYYGQTPTGGFVSFDGGNSYTAYSNFTLEDDLTVSESGKLVVEKGATLTVSEGAKITNNGLVDNKGAISGDLQNDGIVCDATGTVKPTSGEGTVYEAGDVVVTGGTGNGSFKVGETVAIKADDPEEGKIFYRWELAVGSASLADDYAAETSFPMPEGCVMVKAVYVDADACVIAADGTVEVYRTIQEAVASWKEKDNSALKLFKNVYFSRESVMGFSGDLELSENSVHVLDLNDHTMGYEGVGIINSGTLTIKNGCLSGSGETVIYNAGTLNLEKIAQLSTSQPSYYPHEALRIGNSGTVVIGEGVDFDALDIQDEENAKVLQGLGEVTIDASECSYDGTEQEPAVSVKNYAGDTLELGRDFEVSYKDNVNAGTATATVTGKGNYTGTKTTAFQIKLAGIASAKLDKTAYTYTGKALKPSVTVKGADGKTLKAGTDYTVTYSANKSVGTAKVTVSGTGNYAGAKTMTFAINPKGTSLGKSKAAKKSFTAKWKKQSGKMAGKRVTGYQVRYSLSKKMTKAKTKVAKGYKATSKTIKKLKSKKKYYVQVRTYMKVGGKTHYSTWSKAKSVKVK